MRRLLPAQIGAQQIATFALAGPDAERLVKGRERIYINRFWNELSANPKAID